MEDPKAQFSNSNIHGLGAMRAPNKNQILHISIRKHAWEQSFFGKDKHSMLMRKIINKNGLKRGWDLKRQRVPWWESYWGCLPSPFLKGRVIFCPQEYRTQRSIMYIRFLINPSRSALGLNTMILTDLWLGLITLSMYFAEPDSAILNPSRSHQVIELQEYFYVEFMMSSAYEL